MKITVIPPAVPYRPITLVLETRWEAALLLAALQEAECTNVTQNAAARLYGVDEPEPRLSGRMQQEHVRQCGALLDAYNEAVAP